MKCKMNENTCLVYEKSYKYIVYSLFIIYENKLMGKTEVLGVKPSVCCFKKMKTKFMNCDT